MKLEDKFYTGKETGTDYIYSNVNQLHFSYNTSTQPLWVPLLTKQSTKLTCEAFYFEYFVFNNILVAYIPYQNDSIIKRGEFEFKHFTSSGDFKLLSAEQPEICVDKLFLQGNDKQRNSNWMCYAFSASYNLTNYLLRLEETMKAFDKFNKDKIKKIISDYRLTKLIAFMKWKRDVILTYLIEHNLDPIVYFTLEDEQALRDIPKEDLIEVYNTISQNIRRNHPRPIGLGSSVCPFCVYQGGYCKTCSYLINHNLCSSESLDNTYGQIKHFIPNTALVEIFSPKAYLKWWSKYKAPKSEAGFKNLN